MVPRCLGQCQMKVPEITYASWCGSRRVVHFCINFKEAIREKKKTITSKNTIKKTTSADTESILSRNNAGNKKTRKTSESV